MSPKHPFKVIKNNAPRGLGRPAKENAAQTPVGKVLWLIALGFTEDEIAKVVFSFPVGTGAGVVARVLRDNYGHHGAANKLDPSYDPGAHGAVTLAD